LGVSQKNSIRVNYDKINGDLNSMDLDFLFTSGYVFLDGDANAGKKKNCRKKSVDNFDFLHGIISKTK